VVENLITEHLDIWTSAIKTKSAAGRGSSKKLELVGVKKLRELILELAVRGKLIPQDPNDEPASELLNRIEAEKAKLVKEGKIKKSKPLPQIAENEKPFELPDGWAIAYIPQVVSYDKYAIKRGPFGSALKKAYFTPSGIKVYEQQHAIGDDFARGEYYISEQKFKELSAFEVKPNDLIISCSGTVGRVAIAPNWMEKGIINQALLKVTLNESVLTNVYFKILFPAFYMQTETLSDLQGTAQKNMVSVDTLKSEPFPLPSISEQHRIIAKVDELMALCDQLEAQTEASIDAHKTLVEVLLATLSNAKDADELNDNWQTISQHFDVLFTTQASIDQLKQTILQLAVMGKLVKQDPKDEPASKLLERIATEKQQLIKDGKIKKQKPLPPITDDEKPFELPQGWDWIKLDDLSTKSGAGWSPQCKGYPRASGNWGVLKVSAVSWGKYNPEENKELPDSLSPRPEYEVNPGDFLISRANTAELVAKAVVVPEDTPRKLMMSDKIIRFNFSSLINLDYIQLINDSSQARAYYAAVAGGTSSSMKNVSREQIRNLVFALPSMNEQNRIVAKVNDLMALCDSLKIQLNKAQTTQQQLTEAIVEQAVS
jgi:type I restriction enzyme S subunit